MNYKNKITIITYNANGIKRQKKSINPMTAQTTPK